MESSIHSPVVNYAANRNRLDNGDLLFFEGNGVISKSIKLAQKLAGHEWWQFSHVGTVHRDRDADAVQCIESSTMGKIADCLTGGYVKGFRVVMVSHLLHAYDGNIWWLPMSAPAPVSSHRNQQARAMAQACRRFSGLPYENDQIDLVLSALDGGPRDEKQEADDMHSVFCSELAWWIGKEGGKFRDEGKMPHAYAPAELMSCALSSGWARGTLQCLKRS